MPEKEKEKVVPVKKTEKPPEKIIPEKVIPEKVIPKKKQEKPANKSPLATESDRPLKTEEDLTYRQDGYPSDRIPQTYA